MICPSCGYDNIEGTDRCENCMKSLRDLDVPRAEATSGLARSVMEDDLSRFSHEEALTAKPGEKAAAVVRRMKEAQTACALILADGKLAGIFTERDALRKMAAAGDAALLDAPIEDLMRREPESLHETDSVAAALNKMSMGRYLHIPVARRAGGYSIISGKNLLQYIAQKDW